VTADRTFLPTHLDADPVAHGARIRKGRALVVFVNKATEVFWFCKEVQVSLGKAMIASSLVCICLEQGTALNKRNLELVTWKPSFPQDAMDPERLDTLEKSSIPAL